MSRADGLSVFMQEQQTKLQQQQSSGGGGNVTSQAATAVAAIVTTQGNAQAQLTVVQGSQIHAVATAAGATVVVRHCICVIDVL